MTTTSHETAEARPRTVFSTLWPGALGAVVAVGTAYGLADGRDVYHHRADRVVTRSLAEFCCVLDVVLAVLVAMVALTA